MLTEKIILKFNYAIWMHLGLSSSWCKDTYVIYSLRLSGISIFHIDLWLLRSNWKTNDLFTVTENKFNQGQRLVNHEIVHLSRLHTDNRNAEGNLYILAKISSADCYSANSFLWSICSENNSISICYFSVYSQDLDTDQR